MDKIIDKKRFNRIFRPFKNKMNELITKDKAEFSDSFSITNGENDLSFSPIDNGLELSTNNANNKMIISNDGKITMYVNDEMYDTKTWKVKFTAQ